MNPKHVVLMVFSLAVAGAGVVVMDHSLQRRAHHAVYVAGYERAMKDYAPDVPRPSRLQAYLDGYRAKEEGLELPDTDNPPRYREAQNAR
jgi:hypothetical protein